MILNAYISNLTQRTIITSAAGGTTEQGLMELFPANAQEYLG